MYREKGWEIKVIRTKRIKFIRKNLSHDNLERKIDETVKNGKLTSQIKWVYITLKTILSKYKK